MGYMLRVRMSSFFAGVALSSAVGFYYLYKDYLIAHDSISNQIKTISESLDARITVLETLKEQRETASEMDHSE
ncbi:hypothetical protein ZOSMA_25G00550 [Zostera marina]|uniref:Uncharacterized protein n=1 Tax=Zostera marina TaxID=29655 RepID=A0A0K9PF39_ZOSMR|nr:hypothetical protein ZOSMA_25G00550 [Zostera marina]